MNKLFVEIYICICVKQNCKKKKSPSEHVIN